VTRTVIVGASRQGSVVLEVLRAHGEQEILGFLDDDEARHGGTFAGLPVLGGTGWAGAAAQHGLAAAVAIGSNPARMAVAARLRRFGVELINAVHPSAIVQHGASMGSGNLLCAGVILVVGTRLEDDVVVNTGSTVDHDSRLETGAHIASGVHTAGCVTVGRGAFIGVGSVLGPSVTIGEGTIVGAGSVVLTDLPSHVLAFGTPARVIRELDGPIDWQRLLAGSRPPG
jgi:sugar O-acyltransferase (sialic acid O-acetyltransferase NeuD family)